MCHTPRQCVIYHGDRTVTPPVMCDCQRIAEEKAEAAFQKRQEEFRIERMKSSGLQDRYLHDYTFANDKGYNPEIKKAQRYVTEWAMMKENCIGLLLWGNVGTGKTFIAACIANALIENGVSVLMTNFSKILNSLTGMFDVDRNNFIESFNRYSLLIIDDLGIERNSEFALEQVFNVIDSRYRSKKPLIITTNLTLDESSTRQTHCDLQRNCFQRRKKDDQGRVTGEAPFGGSAGAKLSKRAKSTDAKIDSGRCDFGKCYARNQKHESGRNQKLPVASPRVYGLLKAYF